MKNQIATVRPVLKRPTHLEYQFRHDDKGRLLGRYRHANRSGWKPWRRACVSCYSKHKVFRRAEAAVCGLHLTEPSHDEKQYQSLLQLQDWAAGVRLQAAKRTCQQQALLLNTYQNYCRQAKCKYDELRQAWSKIRQDLQREQASRLALETCAMAVVRRAQAEEEARKQEEQSPGWRERALGAEARAAQLEQEWQAKFDAFSKASNQQKCLLARTEAEHAKARGEARAATLSLAQEKQLVESWRHRAQTAESALLHVQQLQQQALWWNLPGKLPPLVPAPPAGPAAKLVEAVGK